MEYTQTTPNLASKPTASPGKSSNFNLLVSTVSHVVNSSILNDVPSILNTCIQKYLLVYHKYCEQHGFIVRVGKEYKVVLQRASLKVALENAAAGSSTSLLNRLLKLSPEGNDHAKIKSEFKSRLDVEKTKIIQYNEFLIDRFKKNISHHIWKDAAETLGTHYFHIFNEKHDNFKNPFYNQQQMSDFVQKLVDKSTEDISIRLAHFEGTHNSTREEQFAAVMKIPEFHSIIQSIRDTGEEILARNRKYEQESREYVSHLLKVKLLDKRAEMEGFVETADSKNKILIEKDIKIVVNQMKDMVWKEIADFGKQVCLEEREGFLQGYQIELEEKSKELLSYGISLLEGRREAWENFFDELGIAIDKTRKLPSADKLGGMKMETRINALKSLVVYFREEEKIGTSNRNTISNDSTNDSSNRDAISNGDIVADTQINQCLVESGDPKTRDDSSVDSETTPRKRARRDTMSTVVTSTQNECQGVGAISTTE